MGKHLDPLTDIVYNQIKRGIKVSMDNECFSSVVILIYAAIEAMANLNRPVKQKQVEAKDFIEWVDKYINIEGNERVTGEEFYSARCAIIHTYGAQSRRTIAGKARIVGYVEGGKPPVRFDPNISKNIVLVDIRALSEAFYKGVDKFLIEIYADDKKRPIVERRVESLFSTMPTKRDATSLKGEFKDKMDYIIDKFGLRKG